MKFYNLQKITAEHAEEYKAAVNRVIDSGWFLQGEENKRFEQHYAEYIGTKNCVAVANGLDALKLIIRAYKEMGVLSEGDEIIVPANTYIATIIAISDNGLVPVLVEPTWEHLEIDIDRIEEAITPKTKGIMIVHLYGRSAYDERLKAICEKHHLKLMEDCAQAQGGRACQQRLGSLGDAAAHSFYPGKNLGAFGDAGAVTTDDDELAEVIRALANYGSQQKYVFKYVGMNSRMSEMDAAVLSVKLKYLDEDNHKRQRLAAYYYEHISNPLITLPKRLPDAMNVYHQFPIFCERRDELQEYLSKQGIQTLIHYPIPPHKQECYINSSQFLRSSRCSGEQARSTVHSSQLWGRLVYTALPITERIHEQELSIPMNQVVTEEEAKMVVEAINSFR